MTKTELLELIRNGETSGVDFKRDTLDNRALAKVLVSFANFQGGQVLLGVDDDGSIRGTTRENLEEWVMTTCRDKIRPELIPFFDRVRDVEPGKDVAIVRVERGWTVHHVWHDQHATYYIRVGTVSREASREELERLFQQRGAFKVEARPVSGSTMADLDRRRLKDYFGRVRQQAVPADDDETGWRTLLANTELLESEALGSSATVSAILLFGTQPNRFLPQAGIDAVAYCGREKDYAARERQALRGPLLPLMNASGQLIENGLVEQAVEFCRRNLPIEAVLEGGARRRERWPYPEEALREAIVNALVHRDYLLSATDIELSLYEDRLEVISPGRLPNGITPARMRAGCRASRNQILKDVMRDCGYLEHMGMGVPRKIVKLTVEQNGREPDLEEDVERFTVRLWRRQEANG
ncbi:MAG: putative DNA binding domain-containing protein [Candidatus Riflebacteria bacterium]|nr:putative DNA binding domain-containing protein [Candidatus Riflebacteria bacterium]